MLSHAELRVLLELTRRALLSGTLVVEASACDLASSTKMAIDTLHLACLNHHTPRFRNLGLLASPQLLQIAEMSGPKIGPLGKHSTMMKAATVAVL